MESNSPIFVMSTLVLILPGFSKHKCLFFCFLGGGGVGRFACVIKLYCCKIFSIKVNIFTYKKKFPLIAN